VLAKMLWDRIFLRREIMVNRTEYGNWDDDFSAGMCCLFHGSIGRADVDSRRRWIIMWPDNCSSVARFRGDF
jgi:hypothetical protein